jgi:two-component system, cell cycle sensor histidine kinase and response regulator CckA
MTSDGGGPANANRDEPDSGPRPFAWTGTGNVLVADDEPAVRTLTARALQKLGLSPLACEDGPSAVAAFSAEPARWRLVVIDLSMPGMDGVETLLAMRRVLPAIPAVISSGYAEDELLRRFPGCDGIVFLQKPFTVQTLSMAVRMALGAPTD